MGEIPATRPAAPWSGTALRAVLWLVLGSWIGAFGLFALVVARTAFEVLPSTEVAGQLVAPILTTLHLSGVAAGLGVALLALALGRSRLLQALPLVLALACLYSQFGVTAEIAEIRPLLTGPEGNAEAAARWGELHRRSVLIFGLVWVGAILLVVLHAREDARGAQGA